jgi:hypothetical protein
MSIEDQINELSESQDKQKFRQDLICSALTGIIARRTNYDSSGEPTLIVALAIKIADEVLKQIGSKNET